MIGSTVSKEIQAPDWQCGLSAPGLAWLLQSEKTEMRLSPRDRLGESKTPDADALHQLLSSGLLAKPVGSTPVLTPLGREVVSTLSSPVTNITLRVWGKEEAAIESCAYFPGNVCGSAGVLLNEQPDGSLQLAGMIDALTLVSMAAKMIPAEAEEWIAQIPFDAHLDSVTAAVLCAVFDIGRTAYRRQRFPDTGLEPGTALSIGEIAGYLEARWGMSDFDQLITYLPATSMRGEPPSRIEIEAAVGRLTVDDFLKESLTGRFVIGEPLRPLIPALYGLRSGLQWQRVNLLPDDETAVSHRVFLVGPGGAVLMFSPTVSDHVYMTLISGDEIAQFLAREVATILPLQSPPDSIHEPKRECAACHCSIREGAGFCTSCGKEYVGNTSTVDKTAACHNCGRDLRTGAKFCTYCGYSAKR